SVRAEVHISNGLPAFAIVGMPETAVKESKDRVRAAIINSGFEFPNRKITVNLSPADLPKEGGRYDLPIALGVLSASGQLDTSRLKETDVVGELALTGELRPIAGLLPTAIQSMQLSRALILPYQESDEVSFLEYDAFFTAETLRDVVHYLNDQEGNVALMPPKEFTKERVMEWRDFAEVRGQHFAKRALEIAAAGGHNILLM